MPKMTVVWLALALVFFAIIDSSLPNSVKAVAGMAVVCIAVVAAQRHAQSGG